jgi:hypothetical protein
MAIGTLFGGGSESSGLYGIATGSAVNPVVVSQTYFEWFIFTTSAGTPATPTGGSWNFTSNIGTAPAGWFNYISGVPLNSLWFSIAFVDSRNPLAITWSTPGLISSQSVYATAYADVFTGNGSTVAWTLSNDPVVVNNTDVSINGVTQRPTTDYTVSGTTLTTTTAAPLNAIILVKYRQALPLSYYGAASNVQFTPVGALTATNVQAAIAEVVTDLALSSGSSTVGYLPAGTGAVATTAQAKFRESVSVLDFGAVSGGSTTVNDAAFAAARAVTNRYDIPTGTYALSASPDPFLDCFTAGGGVTLVVGGVSYDCSNAFAGPLRYVASSATKTDVVHAKTGNTIQYWQDGGAGTANGFYKGLAITTDSHFAQVQPATNGGSTDLLFQRSTLNADPAGNRFNVTFEEATDRMVYSYATTASGAPSFDSYLLCVAGLTPTLEFPAIQPRFSQGWLVTTRAAGSFGLQTVPSVNYVQFQKSDASKTYLTMGTSGELGFYSSTGVQKQTITGSRGGNAALASLLTALAANGLITDSTTA